MMEIIVFGTGEVGKNAASLLEQDFRILFFVDNDEKKWGTQFFGYEIKNPVEIKQYDCDIVIASLRYGIGIANQIEQMSISRERIFFFRRFMEEEQYGYEIYPLIAEKIERIDQDLIQYDLYHTKECKTKCKKVLIFCTFFSTYAKQLIENISDRYDDVEFSILTNAETYKYQIKSDQLKHIYCFRTMCDLKTILEQLPVYDAMQLLWIEREWACFYQLIRMKTRRLNLNVGGSDFYRTDMAEKDFKKNLIACADGITAETEGTVAEFSAYYGKEAANKTDLLPFGIEVLERIDERRAISKQLLRKKYHIPQGRIIVTCGHNANSEHQHGKLIDALNHLREEIKKQIVCVFPMTYPEGCGVYINRIEERLKETGLTYVILREFMDFQQMAEYALISDIMLHVQRTDQLSSTMLEEMYAGSVVLAGKWLPYESLHRMGIFFLDVESVMDITQTVEMVVLNIEEYQKRCKGNRDIIHNHSSWDILASRWHALWE